MLEPAVFSVMFFVVAKMFTNPTVLVTLINGKCPNIVLNADVVAFESQGYSNVIEAKEEKLFLCGMRDLLLHVANIKHEEQF